MSAYGDIIDGTKADNAKRGLVYTKKCGWIDLGHARPENAKRLLDEFKKKPKHRIPNKNYFAVDFYMQMQKGVMSSGVRKVYAVRRDLTPSQENQVALTIFLDVSHSFERYQQMWPYSFFTQSGYSVEDLVSNLVGFYRALHPKPSYINKCDPTSKEFAQEIWKKHGSVETTKNRRAKPLLFHKGDEIAKSPRRISLPSFLNRIKPLNMGRGPKDPVFLIDLDVN